MKRQGALGPHGFPGLWLALISCTALTTRASAPICDVLTALRLEEEICQRKLNGSQEGQSLQGGCAGHWEQASCWPHAALGQTVELVCPRFFQLLTGKNGSVFRTCTPNGWTRIFPRVDVACGYDDVNDTTNEERRAFYQKLRVVYTTGYATSLVSLAVALGILGTFRRLHCPRNYIHMHLFSSFILRALSNFVRDAMLFSDNDPAHCDAGRVGCKVVMVFFQYCIMVNFSWLLGEGLYLHTLLTAPFFSQRAFLHWLIILGWGAPAAFVTAWALARHFWENVGCWFINSETGIWWIIRGPIILSILVNFVLFVNTLRILTKKLQTPETCRRDAAQYRRLAKSSLLLMPLFGVLYVIFAFSPEQSDSLTLEIQFSLELAAGSFQGFLVAVLYCFLNGEVQLEMGRWWSQRVPARRVRPPQPLGSSLATDTGSFALAHGPPGPRPSKTGPRRPGPWRPGPWRPGGRLGRSVHGII
ncbi:secretin receptor [Ornithorhynchus anatinus]|uniref:Secretin receptor n=1 Tax=Ornithorhynchus anatinus TaxID=9258 RepID=A0A6I8PEF4_ORNAN|nr:secretin receptor [Ornithorhynchus anatinus]